jgi:excinuclease ABC subunit B
VLIGINLLREGLDLPEVSLVAILDADQEGFLRSDRSLIQTIGRAARNVNGRAIFYADRITGSMERAIDETKRRRDAQREYNDANGITPKTVIKSTEQVRFITRVADAREGTEARHEEQSRREAQASRATDPTELIAQLEKEMKKAAADLDFETAARLRDELFEIRAKADGARSRSRGSFSAIRAER